jgi:EmrB/QacA subfamily drug resistance transporter
MGSASVATYEVSAASAPARPRLVVALVACTLIPSLSQSILIPALPSLAHLLGVGSDGAAWTVTAYLLTASAGTPLVGRLGDRFGVRRMMLAVIGVFLVGSAVCLVASSLPVMIAGRLLQGAVAGTFPLSVAITRRELPGPTAAKVVGLLSGVVAVGTALGFVLGGLLTDHGGVRAIFWLGLALAVAAGTLAARWVPETPPGPRERIDVPGGLLLVIGVVLPLIGVSRANVIGWTDVQTIGLIVLGAAVLVGWVALELRVRTPLLDVRVLANPTARMTNLATFCIGWAMFGLFVLTPQLASGRLGLDATSAGLLLAPGALAMLVAGPVAAAAGRRVGDRVPLCVGSLIAGVGLICLAMTHTDVAVVTAFVVVTSIGIGVAFPSMPSLAASAASPERVGEAIGFNSLWRGVGSAVGAQISAAIVASDAGGFSVAYLIAAGAAVLGSALALTIPTGRARRS